MVKVEEGDTREDFRQALGGRGQLPDDWESTAVVLKLPRWCSVCPFRQRKKEKTTRA